MYITLNLAFVLTHCLDKTMGHHSKTNALEASSFKQIMDPSYKKT